MRAVVAREQARHRQRVVQAVLQIVIDSVAAEITGEVPVEQPFEVGERRLEALHHAGWPGLRIKLLDGALHRRHGTHLHGVGDVVVTASVLHGDCSYSTIRVIAVTTSLAKARGNARVKFADTSRSKPICQTSRGLVRDFDSHSSLCVASL
jgi:hypothetical protein